MNIVVAIPYAPWPVTRGTDRLILNLLDGLAARHNVALVTIALSRDGVRRLGEIEKSNVTVRAILAPHRRSIVHRIYHKVRNVCAAILTGVPAAVSYAAFDSYLELIADTASEIDADIVLASYWHLYRLPAYVKDSKLVLVTHDLDFVVNPGRLKTMKGLARRRAAKGLQAQERIERKAYENYDTILTVTASDAEVLRRQPFAAGRLVFPLPLALDLSSFNPGDFERKRNRILFMGMLQSDFNRDALQYFINDVFPSVLEKNPQVKLEVVGYGADEQMREMAGTNVSFAGGVDDVRPFIGGCSLMVLPLRFCGGVRIRMMEAAAMGTPVVGTPLSVAGLGLRPGEDYLEAESPGKMADAIVGLLENGKEARRVGDNARKWAEKNIAMDNYPARLDDMFEMVKSSNSTNRLSEADTGE
jgi:glycosyltransferase involved in cell wall biosynthesis